MSVSFIMPVFNESISELKTGINSILNQTYQKFNLIIIDDNPKNFQLKEFLKELSLRNKKITLLFNSKSIGAARSRNKGIRNSNSDLIAIMDADDISKKNRLHEQIIFMDKYNLDFVFSNCKDFDNAGFKPKNISWNSKVINQSILKYLFSHYYDCAVHSSWLVKKDVYKDLDGYRNMRHGEDFDFIIRVLSHGYRIGYQPEVLIYKRQRSNGVSSSDQLRQFNISMILMKYARHFNYQRIIPLNNIYKSQNEIDKKSINRFNEFLKLGHAVKHDFSIKVFIKFLFNIVTSMNSVKYLIEVFKAPLYKSKISKMIMK